MIYDSEFYLRGLKGLDADPPEVAEPISFCSPVAAVVERRMLLARCPCEEHDYCDEACRCEGVARK